MVTSLLLGAISAVGVAIAATPTDRTFAAISGPTQSLMSLTLPFLGVLLVRDLRRSAARSVFQSIGAAVLLAVIISLLGVTACALAAGIVPSAAAEGRWQHAALVVLGSVLVQALAQLTGTGFGLLIRPAVLACLATIVIPLGLWLLMGAVPVLRPLQWLTPYVSARHLLAGEMTWLNWGQWLLVVAIWGGGPNLVGAWRTHRAR